MHVTKPVPQRELREVSLAAIEPHPDYVPSDFGVAESDRWLLDSILEHGMLSPLNVHVLDDHRFGIVDGHRRYLCASALGIESVPCFIQPRLSDADFTYVRFVLRDTSRRWTGAEFVRWKRTLKSHGVVVPSHATLMMATRR